MAGKIAELAGREEFLLGRDRAKPLQETGPGCGVDQVRLCSKRVARGAQEVHQYSTRPFEIQRCRTFGGKGVDAPRPMGRADRIHPTNRRKL